MIHLDVTKTAGSTHRSGLTRVTARLQAALGPAARTVAWDARRRALRLRPSDTLQRSDWWLTAELLSEAERPGLTDFLRAKACRTAAIYHDAIPLKLPHITWPQSVARHPGYLKLLASFDRVWAVSRASREELLGFWRWQNLAATPPVEVLALGADFDAGPRRSRPTTAPAVPRLLCLGILEPRKNQAFLLEVCAALWQAGLSFELHVVGRVNPHFGRPITAHIERLRRKHPSRLFYHRAADDAAVARLFAHAHATVFPTLAEGCGLPLLESLWCGVPCVCSDLPVLRENADGGGCLPAPVNDSAAWQDTLRRLLTDQALHARLCAEAASRSLPTWVETAQTLAHALR